MHTVLGYYNSCGLGFCCRSSKTEFFNNSEGRLWNQCNVDGLFKKVLYTYGRIWMNYVLGLAVPGGVNGRTLNKQTNFLETWRANTSW